MSQSLFPQTAIPLPRLQRGASGSPAVALDLKSLLCSYEPLRDSPMSAPAAFLWRPQRELEDEETDDEDTEGEIAEFIERVEGYLDATTREKTEEYGFDFKTGTPLASDRYWWEPITPATPPPALLA